MKEGRAFGWVQDPAKWGNLRRAVGVFCPDSAFHKQMQKKIRQLVQMDDGRQSLADALSRRPLQLTYRELIGTAFTPRSAARCNGIIQAAIEGQKRGFIADWPADNFLRWAHALGFVRWHASTDRFDATARGISLSKTTENSDAEYRIYAAALLSYPPATRVMNLLGDAAQRDGCMTKFAIGGQLGFQGEKGFTHIDENFFVKELALASKEDKKTMKRNWEGDADKYARMICSWMSNLKHPWARKVDKEFSVAVDGTPRTEKLTAYALTKRGFEERKRTSGISSSPKSPKFVPYEMLCTKSAGRDFLRKRRALITQAICKKPLSIDEIKRRLASENMQSGEAAIQADLDGLRNIGIFVEELPGGRFHCRDNIRGLRIPRHEPPADDAIRQSMEKCGERLHKIPRDFLVLVEMSFDKTRSRMFEIKIVELLTQHCNFSGKHLGGGSRPDGAVYCKDYGVIIDAKSYAEGFSIPVTECDKMARYVYEAFRHPADNKTRWWSVFPPSIQKFLFLFVSGKFTGDFSARLHALGNRNEQNAPGAAITATTLLLVAEKIAAKEIGHDEFRKKISCLDEVPA
ncbi:MAG: hypothetical protein OD918_08295 [Gammaproteobacteria bacterium]